MRSHKIHQATLPPAMYDKWFMLALFSILTLGLLMMTSASIVISDKQTHQPFYYLFKQLIYLALGVGIGSILFQLKIAYLERYGSFLLIFIMCLLALVLIPGIGHKVNGSSRWLGLGPLGFQVSELAKLGVVIYMAGYLTRRNHEIRHAWTGFLKPMAILAVVAALLLKEPDFGATVVVTVTTLGMMFLAGMRGRYFLLLLALVAGVLTLAAISEPYRIARMTGFMNPWARPYDTGYQLTQSLIAFGRGGFFGVGLGKSIQKMFYLPEAHTDFLFAVIAEELGFVGMLVVIALFLLLVVRIFMIGRASQYRDQHFAAYLSYGFAIWLAIQFIVSIGVNSGLLPTKGLTLPMMSYGGSSILVNCMVMAIIFRIDYENRALT